MFNWWHQVYINCWWILNTVPRVRVFRINPYPDQTLRKNRIHIRLWNCWLPTLSGSSASFLSSVWYCAGSKSCTALRIETKLRYDSICLSLPHCVTHSLFFYFHSEVESLFQFKTVQRLMQYVGSYSMIQCVRNSLKITCFFPMAILFFCNFLMKHIRLKYWYYCADFRSS